MTKQTTIISDSNNNTAPPPPPPPPHVVLVPLMAQGHIIPMLDMARLLAERGTRVTFITTPVNTSRIKPIIVRVHESNLPIDFIEAPFPLHRSWPTPRLSLQLLALPLEQRLKNLVPRPTCMINDMFNPWTANVARSLNIRRLVFHGPSCIHIYCSHVFHLHKIYETVTDEFEEIAVPGLTDYDDVVEETADGVVINTFDDVEPMFVEAYKKVVGKDVWTVGPLCLYDKDDDFSARIVRGNKAAVDQEKLLCWLDSMEENSVLYISFGSLIRMNVGQILEIGSGLEASEVPFIWVIKDAEKCPKVEEWLEGHCGWNSTLEAASNGVPMITWPQFGDQFLNERLVVEFLRIGIAIGVKKPVFNYGEDEIPVRRDDVERAVRSLMNDGEVAEERRIRAREIKEKAIKAMEGGGSSYENITKLVEYMKQEPRKVVQRTKA
ncbi:UDP-glycosyltransferase 73C1-like [Dioscorea cayenensis subsp. rotundata]|uniref:UDP-glycosyltransferase 73C1-like n=1 Tax=Dioscorea cayennensis subsp. rotundata TaxID=55577 RepID=A0AB40CR39_DIOCR|nr:UDP-glycosyltransferase 73C1-like [Dioscorea cayenensis subsp. rotundata]